MTSFVNIDVEQNEQSGRSVEEVRNFMNTWILEFKNNQEKIRECLQENGEFTFTDIADPWKNDINSVTISLSESVLNVVMMKKSCNQKLDLSEDVTFIPSIYKLNANDNDGKNESLSECSNNEEEIPFASCISLPAVELRGLWNSLFFDNSVKSQLINFISTSILFADRDVNPNTISWNKLVLLYGPPGTGKTSLCKALAQTVSIRLKNRFHFAKLIEINSHSLFSRWFSESGKLIVKLFNEIHHYISIPNNLVFVLIDEVESLVQTRQMLMSGNDPSDAMRVVNAVLTEIDKIKNYTNIVILTTSNITGAIDLAFVDRADIKQYIGCPNEATIYEIYRSCLNELIHKNIVLFSETILPYTQLNLIPNFSEKTFAGSKLLQTIAVESHTLSGRVLRKLPFLAIAYYSSEVIPITISQFLEMLKNTVKRHFEQVSSFTTTAS